MPEESSSARGSEAASTPAGASAPEKVRATSALRQFLGLFVVPLLVVAMCVGVFVMFGWVAYDRNSVGDYLDDLRDSRSVFAHRRKQAAYELSKILSADPEALQKEPGAGAELRRLFQTSEDLWVRRYLALVLGRVQDTEIDLTSPATAISRIGSITAWLLRLSNISRPWVTQTVLDSPHTDVRRAERGLLQCRPLLWARRRTSPVAWFGASSNICFLGREWAPRDRQLS